MGKNFNRAQNTVCLLLFVSFVAGIISVYFNKVGGVRVGRYFIGFAIALVPMTILYVRESSRSLSSILLASLGGLTLGGGVAFVGLWYVYENPSRMWLGPKWLGIGTVLVAAFVKSFKQLKLEPPNEVVPGEVFESLSQLEKLRSMEKTLADGALFPQVTKSKFDPMGLAFCVIGLVMMISVIATTESRMNRLIMTIVLIGTIAFCILIGGYLRKQLFAKVTANIADLNSQRMLALAEIRAEIAKLEASAGDEPSSPTENN